MKLCKMDDYILHFLTGTMAFRSPRPPGRRKGAGVLDAILEKRERGRIKSQEKLQIMQRMQEVYRAVETNQTNERPRLSKAAKIRREKRIGEWLK